MDNKKSQLNIKIDPKLLLKLKSEAIKNGKTLSAFVTERLKEIPSKDSKDLNLEQRLLKIENNLQSLKKQIFEEKNVTLPNTIFSDYGAKVYGETARELFESHRKEKKISMKDALSELSTFLDKYEHSQPLLVSKILSGQHELNGEEMTMAYRYGSCGMRSALADWTNSSLEPLNEAFLNAVNAEKLI